MDLAYWTGETGDVVGAREAAATVTKDMTQVLGANHRHTLFARGNVCRWTALSGGASAGAGHRGCRRHDGDARCR
jgi:hypothetical protein